MTLRVGVVGMGLMGELHAHIYQSLPEVTLVGVVEVNAARKPMLERQFAVNVYENIRDLLPHVDAVSICTPDHLHKEPVIQAFNQKVKVLVEKPLATSSQDAAEIIGRRPDPSFLMVGHILRFDPRIIHCKELIESGSLGTLWYMKIWRHNSLNSGKKIGPRTSVTWFLGIHDIELLQYLTGFHIASVSATGQKLFTPHWDVVQAHFKMENGMLAALENSWILPTQRSSGLDAGIKVIGEKGMVEVNLSHADVAVSTEKDGRQLYLDTYHWPMENHVPHGDLRREIQTFVSSVAAGTIPPVTGEMALEAVKWTEGIEMSLHAGKEIRM